MLLATSKMPYGPVEDITTTVTSSVSRFLSTVPSTPLIGGAAAPAVRT